MIGFQTINLAMLWFFYHPPSFKEKQAQHGKTRTQLLRDFDWGGLFLFIAGCTLFIVGVSWGGSLHPWTSATTLGPLIVGFLTLVGLGFYERHAPHLKEPLFPPRLFRALRHFTVPMGVMAIGGMQYYSNATLWPRLSQLLYATDEISKGLFAEVLPLGTISEWTCIRLRLSSFANLTQLVGPSLLSVDTLATSAGRSCLRLRFRRPALVPCPLLRLTIRPSRSSSHASSRSPRRSIY